MAIYVWTTAPNGRVLVTRAGVPVDLTLGPEQAALMDRIRARWEDLTTTAADAVGVAPARPLAMILRESGGNQNALNGEHPPGIGLTQVTSPSLYRGLSIADVLVPATNLRIGCGLIAWIEHHTPVPDFPRVASIYNAGCTPDIRPHSSDGDPWGYVETAGHIESEVRALNYLIDHGVRGTGLGAPTPPLFDDEQIKAVMDGQTIRIWAEIGDLLEAERERAYREAHGDTVVPEPPNDEEPTS